MLERSSEYLSLIVDDNGVGFDLSTVRSTGRGLGLLGMRERAALSRRGSSDGSAAPVASARDVAPRQNFTSFAAAIDRTA